MKHRTQQVGGLPAIPAVHEATVAQPVPGVDGVRWVSLLSARMTPSEVVSVEVREANEGLVIGLHLPMRVLDQLRLADSAEVAVDDDLGLVLEVNVEGGLVAGTHQMVGLHVNR